MPLRVVLFPSCFWQTRTLALPRSMFGSAERVLVDIARKKQMPLRVALFLLAFCRLEPSRCRAPCSAPPNGFSLISQEKNKCRFASRFFLLAFGRLEPSHCRALCSAPPNGFSLISQEKTNAASRRLFFLLTISLYYFLWG